MSDISSTKEDNENINSIDYFVTYINQWQRNMPEDLLPELDAQEPEHTIWINGIEYARIYKNNNQH